MTAGRSTVCGRASARVHAFLIVGTTISRMYDLRNPLGALHRDTVDQRCGGGPRSSVHPSSRDHELSRSVVSDAVVPHR
jgi:hypothetical protein